MLFLLSFLLAIAFAQPPLPPLDGDSIGVPGVHLGGILPTMRSFGWHAPMVIHYTTAWNLAYYEAWTFYDDVAVGTIVDTASMRRPEAERTYRNKNLAILHALHTVTAAWDERLAAPSAGALAAFGESGNWPTTNDQTTPQGIGYYVGQKVLEYSMNDGLNKGGDWYRNNYRIPYQDYSNYHPVNPAWPSPSWDTNPDRYSIDPNRWTPFVETNPSSHLMHAMTYLTPQLAYRHMFSGVDVQSYLDNFPAPYGFDIDNGESGSADFINQAREVLDEQRTLTEEKKLKAEHFDDKIEALGLPILFMATINGLNLDDYIKLELGRDMSSFDSLTAMWYMKRHFDSIRPHTAIPWLFGEENVQAWGGPGSGTTSIKANDFRSYLWTDYHSEYPSASSCLCYNFAEYLRNHFPATDDAFGYVRTWAAGSSFIEPGVTPAAERTVTWPTLSGYASDCANSRVWGGVHFKKSIQHIQPMCEEIAVQAAAVAKTYIDGTATSKLSTPSKPGRGGIPYTRSMGPAKPYPKVDVCSMYDDECSDECNCPDAGQNIAVNFFALVALFAFYMNL